VHREEGRRIPHLFGWRGWVNTVIPKAIWTLSGRSRQVVRIGEGVEVVHRLHTVRRKFTLQRCCLNEWMDGCCW